MVSDINERSLANWLSEHVGRRGPISVEKFANGQSNPTYRVRSSSGDVVLRRKPFGELLPSAHAVDREFRLLSALHPIGFPVPQPIALCEDDSVIGAAFYVMEMVEGRAFRDAKMPGLSLAERAGLYEDLIKVLARLHSVDVNAVGLSDFGRPGNFFARQVGRWTKQYRATQTDDISAIDKVMEWLAATVPEQQGNSIIHGDFRVDNAIFASGAPNVAAVLDWELATTGDPLADLSYLLMYWVMPPEEPASIAATDFAATGIPTLDQAIEIYCEAAGRAEVPDLHWYFSYNLFRLTAIMQGVKKRMIDGNASSARAEHAIAQIPILADAAWAHARLAGAE